MSTISGLGPSGFDPRLRLDLSSGKRSLRQLSDSIGQLPGLPAAASALPPPPDHYGQPEHAIVDYERAIGLMRGRHTRDMHERHVATLHKICKLNERGFYFCDVGSIAALVATSGQNLAAGCAEYEAPLVELMLTLSAPLQKQRCNDDDRFEAALVELLGNAGNLIEGLNTSVSVAAVDVRCSSCSGPPTPDLAAISPHRRTAPHPPALLTLAVRCSRLLCAAAHACCAALLTLAVRSLRWC